MPAMVETCPLGSSDFGHSEKDLSLEQPGTQEIALHPLELGEGASLCIGTWVMALDGRCKTQYPPDEPTCLFFS